MLPNVDASQRGCVLCLLALDLCSLQAAAGAPPPLPALISTDADVDMGAAAGKEEEEAMCVTAAEIEALVKDLKSSAFAKDQLTELTKLSAHKTGAVVFDHDHHIFWRDRWVRVGSSANAALNVAQSSSCLFVARVVMLLPDMPPTVFAVHLLAMIAVEIATDFRCSIKWTDPHTGLSIQPKWILQGVAAAAMSVQGIGLPAADATRATDEACREMAVLRAAKAPLPTGREFSLVDPVADAPEFQRLLGPRGVAACARRQAVVACIHRINVGKEREAHFDISRQALAEECGGNAGRRWAWHGSSLDGVHGICRSGFVLARRVANGRLYGEGVYFATHSQASLAMKYSLVPPQRGAAAAAPPRYGHVLLCQVLCGKQEDGVATMDRATPGFHTGADRACDPARLVVWSDRMNTSVLPQYVITFRWRRMDERVGERPAGYAAPLPPAELAEWAAPPVTAARSHPETPEFYHTSVSSVHCDALRRRHALDAIAASAAASAAAATTSVGAASAP